MSHRIPYSAKGKGKVNEYRESPRGLQQPSSRSYRERTSPPQRSPSKTREEKDYSSPPLKRIRAPDMDISDLIEENKLTLMGRLTNPSSQRLWSLIPFLSTRWNLKGKAIGSDLGNGCFQFRFDFEEDLLRVLDNRPYHFDQWMVILQRWEPVISATFPSQIPFWIELQGLPKHFWKEQLVYKIGEELGLVLEHDISQTAPKIKVQINGLEPLTKKTVIEFSEGRVALVTLEYKNLKKHCFHCHRLSHEEENCPGRQKSKAPGTTSLPPPHPRNLPASQENAKYKLDNLKQTSRASFSSQARSPRTREDHSSNKRKYDDRDFISRTPLISKSQGYRSTSERRSPPRYVNYSRNEPSRYMARNQHTSSRPYLQWRERATSRDSVHVEHSENSRTRRPPLERETFAGKTTPCPRPVPTAEEVMGELREVTVRYTSCADPTESLARKQRVLQGESRGLMAETASHILAAASLQFNQEEANPSEPVVLPLPPLSPDVPIHPAEVASVVAAKQKKKRGRPPLIKTTQVGKPAHKSPLRFNGAKSSKRNKVLAQNSPRSRQSAERVTNSLDETLSTTKRKSAKQRLTLAENEAGPSTNRAPPQRTIIPAIVKKKVDFHNPPSSLP